MSAITRLFCKVQLHLIALLCLVTIANIILWYFFRLLELNGYIEFDPGPKPDPSQNFPICHLNLKSMSAHNYSEIYLWTAYISLHNFGIIWDNDGILAIPGYFMYHIDHSSDGKRGGVCIYYKTILPSKVLSAYFLQECINFEVSIKNKIDRFIHVYRTPSQSQDKFYDFIANLDPNDPSRYLHVQS